MSFLEGFLTKLNRGAYAPGFAFVRPEKWGYLFDRTPSSATPNVGGTLEVAWMERMGGRERVTRSG